MSDNAYTTSPKGRVLDPDAPADERSYALLLHLSVLLHLIFPGVAILAPVFMWIAKRDSSPYLDDHGREAINFQITLILYSLVAIPLAIVTCGIGALLALLPYPLGLVGMIMASSAANRGEYFRYPMTFRFLH